ncbi:acyl-CoA dehydrogenase family protein [Poseidonocella sp. HB161398]|uniref:acyl-CoA dehydrogenase family protein n=1 Tax=Poseidonocella sp. HB161398 TaxID=2320855 RepID=UPI001109676A|nr:acyl-CoA dehydrogenase family protein [Poseidonocella sp. HB161398]
MTRPGGETALGTHEVENQPLPLGGPVAALGDAMLAPHLDGLAPALAEGLEHYGQALGSAEMREAARDCNRHPPELALFDRGGRRLDEVRFHPGYHRFMALSQRAGYAAAAWEGAPGGHLAHAAMVYMASQVEPGHCCPLTMTHAAIPALAAQGGFPDWRQKLMSRHYDPAVAPLAQKGGATLGMALTEKQGGSDLRANAARAERDGTDWRLSGHKWFCSAPMSDGFLTLAQAPGGLTCFLMPRWLEDRRNGLRIMRLKDKLGNRSNASAEIEYDRALAWQLGEEGRGVQAVIAMVHHTRLDTALAPAGLMRAALAEAHHWVSGRRAFGRRLAEQPLMRRVLADLALDLEGSLALGMHVAAAFGRPDPESQAFARIGVALAKYLSNKLCPLVVGEAMEALGGSGYVEDGPLPMLWREAPLNGIWEGSGNVICLDILRTLAKVPLAAERLSAELEAPAPLDPAYRRALGAFRDRWPGLPGEAEARSFAEHAALLLAASVLVRKAPPEIAGDFLRTRIEMPRGRLPGAVAGLAEAPILARLAPG